MISEDQEIISFGLKLSLEAYSRLKFVGLAKDGEIAVEMALSLKPDIIIMDLGLPRLDGIGATGQICRALPEMKVLIMSSRNKAEDVLASFAAGASGFCRKESSPDYVYAAMQSIMDGQLAIEPIIAGHILSFWQELQGGAPVLQSDGTPFTFTEVELQIISHMADGLNNNAIAAKLGQSIDALTQHQQQLKRSLAALGSIGAN